MSTLLLHFYGNMSLNRTIFPPHLYVYDDLLIYKKRALLKTREMSISYNQISQINLIRGILFAEIEIKTTGADDIRIRYVPKRSASMAKKIIDQKIYFAHAKHRPDDTKQPGVVKDFEKSLARLKELVNKGSIDKKEFEKHKSNLLKKFR